MSTNWQPTRNFKDIQHLRSQTTSIELLCLSLETGVPFRIRDYQEQGGPQDVDYERAKTYRGGEETVFPLGANQHVGPYGTKDSLAALIDALAIAAFQVGGVTAFGCHFEAGATESIHAALQSNALFEEWDTQAVPVAPTLIAAPKKLGNPCIALYGEGPDDKLCKDCGHMVAKRLGKVYWKCDQRKVTSGAGTDHRRGWPTCARFEQRTSEASLYDGRS